MTWVWMLVPTLHQLLVVKAQPLRWSPSLLMSVHFGTVSTVWFTNFPQHKVFNFFYDTHVHWLYQGCGGGRDKFEIRHFNGGNLHTCQDPAKLSLISAVIVEPIRCTKLIPQCKICQSFDHTRNCCNKAPKCVKCAGPHLTSERDKPQFPQPKCCNCGKNHPASYRGREVIKALQKLRDNKNKPKQQTKRNKTVRVVPNNEHQTTQTYKNKQTPWPLVRKWTIPTDRPPIVDEI
jgi:hypothetical protein